jgi:hypothetical protein
MWHFDLPQVVLEEGCKVIVFSGIWRKTSKE